MKIAYHISAYIATSIGATNDSLVLEQIILFNMILIEVTLLSREAAVIFCER